MIIKTGRIKELNYLELLKKKHNKLRTISERKAWAKEQENDKGTDGCITPKDGREAVYTEKSRTESRWSITISITGKSAQDDHDVHIYIRS